MLGRAGARLVVPLLLALLFDLNVVDSANFTTPSGVYSNGNAAGASKETFVHSQLDGRTFRIAVNNGAAFTPRFNGESVCAPIQARPPPQPNS